MPLVAPHVEVAFSEAPTVLPVARRSRVRGTCDASLPKRITLLHLNDLQARYSDLLEGKSRYAYLAGYLRSEIEKDPNTLVMSAGDDYEKGAIAELRSMGESTRQMVQALPIDVRTIGNHDFSYGVDAVVRDATLSAHPVLAANITTREISNPFVSYAAFQVGCVKVGVAGLVTGNYGADDEPTKEPFDGVFEQNGRYAETLLREVNAHRDEVDVMIALTHVGLYTDQQLAMKVPGVDLVIGAHTEDLLKEPFRVFRNDGSRAWVLQAGHYGKTIGRAELSVSDKGISIEKYSIVPIDASLPVAEDVDELALRLDAQHAPDARRAIGRVGRSIARGRPMAEFAWRAVSSTYAVDAMIVGYDVFWTDLPAGDLTLQRLYEAVPVQREPAGTSGFSSLVSVEMPGSQLQALRGRLRADRYAMALPPTIDPKRTYRVAIEKRAHFSPNFAFYGGATFAEGKPLGELIDPLEAYVRRLSVEGKAVE